MQLYDAFMAEETRGGSSYGAGDSGQPGVTPEDIGDIANRVSEDDIEILDPDEVAAPPTADEDPSPVVNPDLVDDPEELRRIIEEASGGQASSASEQDESPDKG